jgi:phosphohistidine phosphatase
MRLYLLRHGIEVNRNTAPVDPEWNRALTPTGVRRMEREAAAMRVLGLEFNEMHTSPSARARETAQIVAEAYDWQHEIVVSDALARGKGFTSRLERQSPVLALLTRRHLDSLLLVGHQPDLSQLASLVLVGTLSLNLELRKGGLCVIDMNDPLDSRSNSIVSLLQPRQLRAVVTRRRGGSASAD